VKTVLLAAILALVAAAPAAADVPRLDIRTAKAIRDEPKVPARLTVGKRTHRIGIEVRGQSSQALPKKPYGFETRRRVRLLGMPAERDWVLNAAFTDPSLLRDALAHHAARRLGLAGSRTRHVELWLNGRRRGLYLLMERAELSRRRVPGTALVELTERRALDRGDDSFPSATGLVVREVEGRAPRRAVRALEASLGGPGWRAHLDEASAVDYVLLTELLKNQDAFLRSTFAHLRGGKLHLGPVWDFDLSAGNVTAVGAAPPEGWLLAGRPWAGALLDDPGFHPALAQRWRALQARGFVRTLLRTVDRRGRVLRAPARHNFARWPVLGKPLFPAQPVHVSHRSAVGGLKAWLVRRAAWMDAALL
jgi:hypothetical protein